MTLLYAMPGNEAFARRLAEHLGWPCRSVDLHRFPDGEALVRLDTHPEGAAAIVCTLDGPDEKLFPLLAAACTARELGATRLGLVAPYLAYMRQDTRFRPGEAVSARIFGGLLGRAFDWLVTVDPHLHRIHDLGQVIPCRVHVVHAAPALAAWIGANVPQPLLIGPDEESAQWVRAVAHPIGAPCVVARKQRRSDREVSIELPDLGHWRGRTPVVLDDIVSTGHTLLETVRCVRGQLADAAPVAVAIHGLPVAGATQPLEAAGLARRVTTNTVPGDTALIDISLQVAQAMCALAG